MPYLAFLFTRDNLYIMSKYEHTLFLKITIIVKQQGMWSSMPCYRSYTTERAITDHVQQNMPLQIMYNCLDQSLDIQRGNLSIFKHLCV